MLGRMLFKNIRDDIDGMIARDPAARSRLEVVLTYPGFHAVVLYRGAHWLFVRHWRLLARMVSHFGRLITGIDIHPGATIGRRLFIDHGTGLVIGETAEIGDDVTLYQGVTLGGVAPSVDSAAQIDRKRHPTLRNNVIVGSGAQVLGPITVGEGARVGANAVAVADVPAGVTVVGIPAKVIVPRKASQEFRAYGMPTDDIADPITRAIDGLLDQVSRLKARVEQLEGEAAHRAGNGEAETPVTTPVTINPEDRHTPDC
ncbi:MAG TPA: serine O-acetyltransferase [Verrucomicrobiae bacterium]|nr:serine O-acetyltransferase [Verrucomicrobiae bacterium]